MSGANVLGIVTHNLTKMSVKMGQNGFSAVDFLFSDRLLGKAVFLASGHGQSIFAKPGVPESPL
jgi:hypothetical protein